MRRGQRERLRVDRVTRRLERPAGVHLLEADPPRLREWMSFRGHHSMQDARDTRASVREGDRVVPQPAPRVLVADYGVVTALPCVVGVVARRPPPSFWR